MESFYLRNVELFEHLVENFDAAAPVPHFSRHEAVASEEPEEVHAYNPDMVVAARIRPMLDGEIAAGFPCAAYPRIPGASGAQIVDLHDLYNHPRGRPALKSMKYRVDRIFDSTSTTLDVYESVVADLVSFAVEGGTGTLFAYGQTGSGKTFTVSQLSKLVTTTLLDGAEHRQQEVYITISELAGNSAFDLLDSRKRTPVLEDARGNTQLAGVTELRVNTQEEAVDLLEYASHFRQTASTTKNDASSRSHSICRIRIKGAKKPEVSHGTLYLVDLAGSEAARDVAKHGADRMRETREINMSLSVLKDCIRGKAEADLLRRREQRDRLRNLHLPIRQSTLTKVLKHVFDLQGGRACRTVVIACINPSLADVAPSKNTLRYAEMLRVPVPGPRP